MGFFDFVSEAKEKHNRSREAREFIKRAKELVEEGNEIYSNAYAKVSIYAHETEYKLRQHAEYKKEIAKEFGGVIGSTLKEFEKFDIDSKTISSPSFNSSGFSIKDSSLGLSTFSSSMSSCIRPSISISDFFFSDDDYYAARSQRDEARRFKERMKLEREVMYNYRDRMSEIRSFIDREKSEIDSLMNKVRKITNELNQGMKKNEFTSEEALYFKGIKKISEKLMALITADFLSDSFSINQKYQKLFAELQTLNKNIPSAPSIKDNTTLKAIKSILDGGVVY